MSRRGGGHGSEAIHAGNGPVFATDKLRVGSGRVEPAPSPTFRAANLVLSSSRRLIARCHCRKPLRRSSSRAACARCRRGRRFIPCRFGFSLVHPRAAQAQGDLARRAARLAGDPADGAGHAAVHPGRHRQGGRAPDPQHAGRDRHRARRVPGVHRRHDLGAPVPGAAHRQPRRRGARHARCSSICSSCRRAISSTGPPACWWRACTASRPSASSSAARR